jgi:hypothetical protein
MRFAAVTCLAAFMTLAAPALGREGPQKAPAEPPLATILAHFFPGYAPVTLGDLAAEVGALTVQDAAYDHSDRSPTVIRADFDGNGHADYAVLIKKQTTSGSDEIFAILMGYGQGRYAKIMESFFGRLSEDIYLGYVAAGTEIRLTVASPGVAPIPLRLKSPAVTLNVLNQASDVLYWDSVQDMFGRAPVFD